ncbi:MAG: Thioredoxin [Alphaproteobacteria bacterium ADurb.Bin438]|nr:MAG: Thioredoxin [Alphaproteobacteria bacterium ADurb.Bin438]
MKMVSGKEFEAEVLKSETPVIVDFFAEWCGPCRQMLPILEEVSKMPECKVKIVKVNIDDAPEIAGKYGVQSIPTFVLVKNGEAVETKVGAMNKSKVIDWVKSL